MYCIYNIFKKINHSKIRKQVCFQYINNIKNVINTNIIEQ